MTIPNSVTTIEWEAFKGCSSLPSVTIPESVTTIEREAFKGCSSLTNFTVAEGSSKYTSWSGILFSRDMKELVLYPNGREGTCNVPSWVSSIGDYAFSGCNKLESIVVGGKVSLGVRAFEDCTLNPLVFLKGCEINYNIYTGNSFSGLKIDSKIVVHSDYVEAVRKYWGKAFDLYVPYELWSYTSYSQGFKINIDGNPYYLGPQVKETKVEI